AARAAARTPGASRGPVHRRVHPRAAAYVGGGGGGMSANSVLSRPADPSSLGRGVGGRVLRRSLPIALLFALLPLLHPVSARAEATTVVGSKAFAESWILGEAVADLARQGGGEAVHRNNLGGTQIVYTALRTGSIDVYPEYTGTIGEV